MDGARGENVAAFPDTNLFLHFRPLNEIDWCDLLEANTVAIKIAPVVTRELEEKKTFYQSRKIKERATHALTLLHGYLTSPSNVVRNQVTLNFLLKEPTPEFASERGLNLHVQDDWLIGALLLFREEYPETPAVIVTDDLPLQVKAKHYEIRSVTPDETLRLPSEPDELEKQNRQLQIELNRYKSRQPVLRVRFDRGEDYRRFEIVRRKYSVSEQEASLQAKLDEAKTKCPLIEDKRQESSRDAIDPNHPAAVIAESIRTAMDKVVDFGAQFREMHNARVRQYYSAYEKYLRASAAFKALPDSAIKLDLVLENSGTCPGEEIHVLLHFPDGFELYDKRNFPKEPKEPAVPPKTPDMFPGLSSALDSTLISDIRIPHPIDLSLPRIRKTNSYDVTMEEPKLNHGFIWKFAPLFVVFKPLESAKSFSIKYRISAANLIEQQTGEVGVVIDLIDGQTKGSK